MKKKVSLDQLASKGLDCLENDEFLIEISQYIEWFSATFTFLTQPSQKKPYAISSVGIDMKEEKEIFLEFTLGDTIDCTRDQLTIMCEQ